MSNTNMVENEAELQARLEERLRRALPMLPAQIRLERHLNLRLGHHEISVDGATPKSGSIRGRYDVVVFLDDKPLLLVELKAPEVGIDESDVEQGLSYARLHQPLIPIVVATNGSTTLVRRTYDGQPLDPNDLAADRLQNVIGAATKLAAAATEEAIRVLLGTQQPVWVELFQRWTQGALKALTGPVQDFGFPLAEAFSIPRNASTAIGRKLDAGTRVVAVHGPPLAGITNVLAQFAISGSARPALFIDGQSKVDILQHLASLMTRELAFGISKDDVRSWLNTGKGLLDLVLVIDRPENGLDELIDMAEAQLLRVVLGMDTGAYERAQTLPGRPQKTALGRTSEPIAVEPLDQTEFDAAMEILAQKHKVCFFQGAEYSPELRHPRTLRLQLATLASARKDDKDDSQPPAEGLVEMTMLPPIVGPELLILVKRTYLSAPDIQDDVRRLSSAFLEEINARGSGLNWIIETWGLSSIDHERAERLLGVERLNRLRRQGYLGMIVTKTLGTRVLVRVEELLLAGIADLWTSKLSELTEENSVRETLVALVSACANIPSGEVALATAIIKASYRNSSILGIAIPILLEMKPTTSRLTEGARLILLSKDYKIPIRLGQGMDEVSTGDLEAWLVLSHLCRAPFEVVGYPLTGNFSLFIELGAFPFRLFKPPPTDLAKVPAFHVHEIPKIGTVLCMHTGVVEPLVQAMLDHAHRFPNELVELAEYAMEKKDAHLAWRVLAVAHMAESAVEEDVRNAAQKARRALNKWWGSALENLTADHYEDPTQNQQKREQRKRDRERRQRKKLERKRRQEQRRRRQD